MSKRHWRDLFLGTALIGLSVWLWFANQYTLELGILIGIMTILWLWD